MVEEIGKNGAISNQKFSAKGMQLSALKGNKQVYDFFKKAGLGDENFVYASDIQNIFKAYDANKNGKLSVSEARQMGFDGSRKEVKQAVKLLNEILETELKSETETYPTKVSDNETNFYDKNGTLKYNAKIVEANEGPVEKYTFYRDGDTTKVSAYAERSEAAGVGVMINYNEDNLPEKEVINNNGNIRTTLNVYDENKNLKTQTIEEKGNKSVAHYDDQKRIVKLEEQFQGQNVTAVTTNDYNDEAKILTQRVQNDPVFLKEGIVDTELKYKMEDDVPENEWELIYRKDTTVDGRVREFSQEENGDIVEKRDGYVLTSRFHENGKTTTVQDGDETHVIEYDTEGNTYAYTKNGESFEETATRLLGENANEEDVQAFRELNKDLIQTYGQNKIEAFRVAEKVRIPGEVEYNQDTKDIFTVNPDEEIALYKKGLQARMAREEKTVTPQDKPENKPSDTTVEGKVPPAKSETTPSKGTPEAGKASGATKTKAKPKVVTLEESKKQLDANNIKYKISGNKLSFVDKKGNSVVMTYQNGYKTHETAYPPNSKNSEGKQLTSRRFYDKEYKNGVITSSKEYFDANPRKIAVQRTYENGLLKREVKCLSDREKSDVLGRNDTDYASAGTSKFMHNPQVKEMSDFVAGKKVKTTHYIDGDINKIGEIETFENGYTRTQNFDADDPSKLISMSTIYPDSSNVVVKRFSNGNPARIALVSEMNSDQELTPIYDNNKQITGYKKADGTELDAQGNLKKCPLAEDLYKQLRCYSDNAKTAEMLKKINNSNIVDVIEAFSKKRTNPDNTEEIGKFIQNTKYTTFGMAGLAFSSMTEPLFEYINNEWGSGLGRAVMDPMLKNLVELGKKYNIDNKPLNDILQNDPQKRRTNYTREEIKVINEQSKLLAEQLRNKYKAILKENI